MNIDVVAKDLSDAIGQNVTYELTHIKGDEDKPKVKSTNGIFIEPVD